jgi:uncharacterized protein YndB with AHSA1/START domain
MQNTSSDTVRFDSLIHASVQDVWKAWTDPNLILQWFGSDPDGEGLKATLDLRPLGTYDIHFRNSNGDEHSCSGVYTVVEDCSRLAFSWEWKSEPGVVSFVTILFLPEGEYTRVHFEHARVGNKSVHNYTDGWQGAFSKLERLLNPKDDDA